MSTPTIAATRELNFTVSTTAFTEDYSPSSTSRATTNFANLARGEDARENLRNVLEMINRRFNDLIHWDNPTQDRYRLELEIVSVDLQPAPDADDFPLMEILDVQILDTLTGSRIQGLPGNNFSSYIRDYDFSILLPAHAAAHTNTDGQPSPPEDFGVLHGKIFQHFLGSAAYTQRFTTAPVICISVSTSRVYRQLPNEHPVLGVEYQQDDYSRTDQYFAQMGLQVRYFKPRGAAAPLAFYFRGDLLNDHSDLALAGTIATMESFQRIYRPEIYNANSSAPHVYRPSLTSSDYSLPAVSYDRVERSQLAQKQGKLAQEELIEPYGAVLNQWAAQWAPQQTERGRR
ncbi:MAG: putative oxygenase MesX [Galactobacter sp.]